MIHIARFLQVDEFLSKSGIHFGAFCIFFVECSKKALKTDGSKMKVAELSIWY